MKKFKRWAALLCTICLAFCITATAWAGNLSVTRYSQEKSNWCWAASAQMVGKYITGTLRSQSLICTYVMGDTSNIPADISQIKTALFYTTSKTAYSGSYLSLATAKAKIDAKRPFIARLGWTNGGGHAVVISGYTNSQLRVIDPYGSSATTNYTYSNMITSQRFQSGTGKWTHSVWVS